MSLVGIQLSTFNFQLTTSGVQGNRCAYELPS
jgi:hypothetical protein